MYKTEQEEFWSGNFGDEYIDRNNDEKIVANNIYLFSQILGRITRGGVNSIIEFGSNIGLNLKAIKMLYPSIKCSAIEINKKAVAELRKFMPDKNIYQGSILEIDTDLINQKFDMALIKGVLIHINPGELNNVYEKLYRSSKKYICVIEYYNPTPVSVTYRNYENRLFKRDFAGELLDRYPDLELVDYGFSYHRDNNFPLDDLSWFLLKK